MLGNILMKILNSVINLSDIIEIKLWRPAIDVDILHLVVNCRSIARDLSVLLIVILE